jgi:hypothetical protein
MKRNNQYPSNGSKIFGKHWKRKQEEVELDIPYSGKELESKVC